MSIDDDEIEHLGARIHLHAAASDLAPEGLVRAEQKGLPGLPAREKGARDLPPAKGSCKKKPAVFARERDSLRNALIDDVDADLRKAVDVPFTRAEVATFDRVVEETVDAVA